MTGRPACTAPAPRTRGRLGIERVFPDERGATWFDGDVLDLVVLDLDVLDLVVLDLVVLDLGEDFRVLAVAGD